MEVLPIHCYEAYRRLQFDTDSIIRESFEDDAPPEKLLQLIWHHQKLKGSCLKMQDGRRLKVLHPGFWNRENGPDFKQAVLQFDGGPMETGDIEIDCRSRNWVLHGHINNPDFRHVILHVLWSDYEPGICPAPSLIIRDVLDGPIQELGRWFETASSLVIPVHLKGCCSSPLKQLDESQRQQLLQQAAFARLKCKAYLLESRARQVGWSQTLWEGLFTALGYKTNSWAMYQVATKLPLLRQVTSLGAEESTNPFENQAILFGVSGLLSDDADSRVQGTSDYRKRLWNVWWRHRNSLEKFLMPAQVWRFHSLRPPNHPLRRLALAAHWLADPDFEKKLQEWITEELPQKQCVSSLLKILQITAEEDPFWAIHWSFGECGPEHPQPLLGQARLTDLAINILLPWFWIRADKGRQKELIHRIEQRYFSWPRAQDNVVLKLARTRLLGKQEDSSIKKAYQQQALMQIVRDFCEESNAICSDCPFPDLVKDIQNRSEKD
ncbi:MAG TPA: DUF2851 family protein [Verrucomicrobiales bacterium]|nr:DUF2851 family protein [Verrucomicrobiales bacterium]HIL71054.1 DUF2851 family protein [Verrucomicrobiota bacterium]